MDSRQRLQNRQSKIAGKVTDYNFIDSWHYLMMSYGWIPFDEFKKMDAHIVNELILRLNKMNEKKRSK